MGAPQVRFGVREIGGLPRHVRLRREQFRRVLARSPARPAEACLPPRRAPPRTADGRARTARLPDGRTRFSLIGTDTTCPITSDDTCTMRALDIRVVRFALRAGCMPVPGAHRRGEQDAECNQHAPWRGIGAGVVAVSSLERVDLLLRLRRAARTVSGSLLRQPAQHVAAQLAGCRLDRLQQPARFRSQRHRVRRRSPGTALRVTSPSRSMRSTSATVAGAPISRCPDSSRCISAPPARASHSNACHCTRVRPRGFRRRSSSWRQPFDNPWIRRPSDSSRSGGGRPGRPRPRRRGGNGLPVICSHANYCAPDAIPFQCGPAAAVAPRATIPLPRFPAHRPMAVKSAHVTTKRKSPAAAGAKAK